MKKRIFAIVMSVCLLFTAFSCVASAASIEVDQTLPTTIRICPGSIIGETTKGKLDAPEVYGSVYVQGWEIREVGATDWEPYDGEPIVLPDKVAEKTYEVRYFAAPFSNDHNEYAYSNVSTVLVKHNPQGDYLYSGTDHWRVCGDCGGKHGEALHSYFEDDFAMDGTATSNTICTVCGAHRTPQWTGLAAFFSWLFTAIFSLIS